MNWHAVGINSVLDRLAATPQGLSAAEADKRLAQYGPNEIRETAAIRPWAIFARQFKSLLILLLAAAAVISGVLGEWIDAVVIAAIVVLNAVIGFYQEFSAEKSIAALRKMSAPRATVR